MSTKQNVAIVDKDVALAVRWGCCRRRRRTPLPWPNSCKPRGPNMKLGRCILHGLEVWSLERKHGILGGRAIVGGLRRFLKSYCPLAHAADEIDNVNVCGPNNEAVRGRRDVNGNAVASGWRPAWSATRASCCA